MSETHGGTLLLHNTMRITGGHLEAYREAMRRRSPSPASAHRSSWSRASSTRSTCAHSFQLYADSDAALRYRERSDPCIRAVNEHCEVVSLEGYGGPTTGYGPVCRARARAFRSPSCHAWPISCVRSLPQQRVNWPFSRALGALLRQTRAERTMVDVARCAGVSVETLRKIEGGRITSSGFFTVAAIADTLGGVLGREGRARAYHRTRPEPAGGGLTSPRSLLYRWGTGARRGTTS